MAIDLTNAKLRDLISLFEDPADQTVLPPMEFLPMDLPAFQDSCRMFFLTGSREICSPIPLESDIDYIALVDDRTASEKMLQAMGFKDCWEDYGDSVEPDPRWGARRRAGPKEWLKTDSTNIIVTEDPIYFSKFMQATYEAKRRNLLNKNARIKLFKKIVDGIDWEPEELVVTNGDGDIVF